MATNCIKKNSLDELIILINKYLKVGGNFLTCFFDGKKIKIPKSNIAWASTIFDQNGNLKNGITYFKHGGGIDFKDNNLEISIDFGPKGEWDGFDSWRLFLFMTVNNIRSTIQGEDEIQDLLIKGVKKGLFIKKENLYFKPRKDLLKQRKG